MPHLSASNLLTPAAATLSAIPIAFGINALLRPAHAITMFEPLAPAYPADDPAARRVVDALLAVYGARNVLWGLATLVPLWCGARTAAGALFLAGSAVAGVDGWVCLRAGGGEWAHWGYAPVLVVVGGLLLSK